MSDDQNLVQKQKIGATILDNRKVGDIAQDFNISILQGYKYEKNIEKYKQIEVLKGVCCYIMEFCYSAPKASIGAKWRFRLATWLIGMETLFHIQTSMEINEFQS